MKKLFEKLMELVMWCWNNAAIRYIFIGGCTTLVNLVCYYVLRMTTGLNLNVANVISIAAAILFAYFANSIVVFRSDASTLNEKFGEFVKFISARLSTMVIEVGGVWLMADIMKINDYIAKFVIQFIVLVLNYFLSKFFVFSKKEKKDESN